MTSKTYKPANVDSDCLQAFDHLYAYLNGELKDPKAIAMMEHHLDHCRSCFTRAEMERELNERLKKSGKSTTPSSLQDRLNKLIEDI
jgi:anti-sigma factor (TIGR02949 family)